MSSQNSTVKLNRRQSLQIGAASTAAGLFAVKELASPAEAKDGVSGGGPPASPYTAPFMVPLTVYQAKQTVSALTPPPGEQAGSGECGRVPHQRWSNWPARLCCPPWAWSRAARNRCW